jgi:hypothetical protein
MVILLESGWKELFAEGKNNHRIHKFMVFVNIGREL